MTRKQPPKRPRKKAAAVAVTPLQTVQVSYSETFDAPTNDARPDEPPPSLIPPEVQEEIDRLRRFNRALSGALRAFLDEEP